MERRPEGGSSATTWQITSLSVHLKLFVPFSVLTLFLFVFGSAVRALIEEFHMKAYQTPVLTKFGAVSQITEQANYGGGGNNAGGGGNNAGGGGNNNGGIGGGGNNGGGNNGGGNGGGNNGGGNGGGNNGGGVNVGAGAGGGAGAGANL
jgi:hypothetical protein